MITLPFLTHLIIFPQVNLHESIRAHPLFHLMSVQMPVLQPSVLPHVDGMPAHLGQGQQPDPLSSAWVPSASLLLAPCCLDPMCSLLVFSIIFPFA